MNSFRPRIAEKLVKQIQKEDRDKSLEIYLTKVFRHFDVEMEDLSFRTYLLQPASIITEVFPSIPREGICVTFDRKHALRREDISFLSWDHPMTTGAIDMVLSSGTGSASFGVLRGSDSPGLLLELLFVLETSGGQSIFVDRFLPKTPLRIVVDHTGKEVTDKFMLQASRVITVLIGLIGLLIAITSDKLIFSMVSYAWAGLGSSFGPLLLLMLKWKKVTWQGAVGGLITGFMVTVIWSELSVLDDILSVRFVSWVMAILVVWLVSLLTREKKI